MVHDNMNHYQLLDSWLTQQFKDDADLPGRVIMTPAFNDLLPVRQEPVAECFGTDGIKCGQFFYGS